MRSYEKPNPEKTVLEPKLQNNIVGSEKSAFLIKDAGASYRKEDSIKLPKSFFVIVSGGEKREKDYFKIISKSDTFDRIKIEFVADPAQLNPDGLLETAKYKQEHYQTSVEDKPDKIFIVSDVDHFINDLIRIKPKCEKLGIILIISNSCFEIWLYYGKFNHKPTDFIIPENYLETSKLFKNYLDKKIKGGINSKTAIFDIETAIANAKTKYEYDTNGIPKLFSTNMFLLAEQILPFIKIELNKLRAENEVKNRLYRK
jgi:hypothetical protein